MADPIDDKGAAKATAEAIKAICELVRPFSEPTLSELGLYIADKIKYIRFKNAIRVAERARSLLDQHGIKAGPVSPKILVAILENAGLEEDDHLVDRWSHLLAAASAGQTIPPAFPAVLAQLQPVDARVLDLLYDHDQRARVTEPYPDFMKLGRQGNSVREELGIGLDELAFSILNLQRLNLIRLAWGGGGLPPEEYEHNGYSVTPFGLEFVVACHGPRPDKPDARANPNP